MYKNCGLFVLVDGRWGAWSSWSTCSTECQHHRKRYCNDPPAKDGGSYCIGNDLDGGNCTGGRCRGERQGEGVDNFIFFNQFGSLVSFILENFHFKWLVYVAKEIVGDLCCKLSSAL